MLGTYTRHYCYDTVYFFSAIKKPFKDFCSMTLLYSTLHGAHRGCLPWLLKMEKAPPSFAFFSFCHIACYRSTHTACDSYLWYQRQLEHKHSLRCRVRSLSMVGCGSENPKRSLWATCIWRLEILCGKSLAHTRSRTGTLWSFEHATLFSASMLASLRVLPVRPMEVLVPVYCIASAKKGLIRYSSLAWPRCKIHLGRQGPGLGNWRYNSSLLDSPKMKKLMKNRCSSVYT